uniref:GYF domain-containing protein n=1 Tax=Parascaris univalens TaxID=6257 RepID=A0A915BU74_PARUN
RLLPATELLLKALFEMTTALPEANQMNFNPSWMRAANAAVVAGNTVNRTDIKSPNESPQDYPLAEPIFVTNRYGREDLLALLSKDANPPAGLDKCPFFVEVPQQPIVLKPLTDVETRLQHNINSSKAISSLSHADRATIATGGMSGQTGNAGPHSATTAATTTQPPFTPAWMTPSGGCAGMGRGSLPFSRGAAHAGPFRGRGAHQIGGTGHTAMASDSSAPSRYVATRGGRGGLTTQGRGGGAVGGAQFNSRAQGLYDPRDPRDRPRQRVRSVSDDTMPSATGVVTSSGGIGVPPGAPPAASSNGWMQVGRTGTSWGNKRANAVPVPPSSLQQQRSVDAVSSGTPAPMPEWMDDEHEREEETASVGAGSFDENGRFRTRNTLSKGSPPIDAPNTAPPHFISTDLVERQPSQAIEASGTQPLAVSNPWNALAEPSDQRADPVTERLAKQAEMNLMLSTASSQPGVTTSSSSIYQHKMNTAGVGALQHSISQPTTMTIAPGASELSDEWYYIDPKNEIQGPFFTAHMEAWFNSGYFTRDLRVRRGADPNTRFITLGDLLRINGSISPFKRKMSPPATAAVVHVPVQTPLQAQIPPQPQQLSRNIWTEEYNAVSLLEAAKVQEERQKLEEEQRRVAEQELKLKEMRDNLLKEEEERLLRERKIRERELELQRQQEELARKAVEEQERAMAREREIEAERKRMAEEMERVKKEQIERALAEARKREEEERLAARRLAEEREKERLKAEEEKKRREREEAEMRMRAEEKQGEEARRRAAIEEEHRRRKEHAEKEAARQRAAEAAAASKIVVTEEFAPATRPKPETATVPTTAWQMTYRVVDDKPVQPKVAPWVNAINDKRIEEEGGHSLLAIQREEEQRMNEERHQSRAKESVSPANAVWGTSAAQKLSWNQPTQVISVEQSAMMTSRGVAWGGAGVRVDARPAVNVMWDGPPLESTNKAAKKSSSLSKSTTSANKVPWQGGAGAHGANTEHEAMKKLFKQSVTGGGNAFTNWIVQRVKELNSQVDADVFAAFIEGVDSPDEIEDYVVGYLGDGRQVKDFIREFLEKRREARSKKQPTDKDDLTHAAVGADALGSSASGGCGGSQHGQGGGGKKKKKGCKGGKVVVDGACLGFKATADPNRINIGEIDTVQPPSDLYRR